MRISLRSFAFDVYSEPVPVASFQPQRPSYGGVPDALILAGAVVGIAMSGFMMIMMAFQFFLFQAAFNEATDGFGAEGFPQIFVWMPIIMLLFGLISMVGAILAFIARGELKRTNGEQGATKAIVAGAIMIVGMGLIGGILVLIGGVLATQNQPRRA